MLQLYFNYENNQLTSKILNKAKKLFQKTLKEIWELKNMVTEKQKLNAKY